MTVVMYSKPPVSLRSTEANVTLTLHDPIGCLLARNFGIGVDTWMGSGSCVLGAAGVGHNYSEL
jgi:hypothetical protein